MDSYDPFEVRRSYWEHGGNAGETARALSATGRRISRQAVHKAVERANKLRPITLPRIELGGIRGATPEDAEAIKRLVRKSADLAGILREPKSTP